jgi:dTDP-4-dehydrorhamnose 3,5-epimerase
MIFTETKLKGAFLIDVERREDERGFFGRAWCKKEFDALGLNSDAVQANVSYNVHRGTLRGMHYQRAPFSESKTVRCTSGSIFDVIVDIRPGSPTFCQWLGVTLTAAGFRMLYVPEGFAHGFVTLEDHSSVHYLVTQYYTAGAEAGLRFDDPAFRIIWPIEPILMSSKDRIHPPFADPGIVLPAHSKHDHH